MRDHKTCDHGNDCCFSHDAVALQEARKEVAAQVRANGGGKGGRATGLAGASATAPPARSVRHTTFSLANIRIAATFRGNMQYPIKEMA